MLVIGIWVSGWPLEFICHKDNVRYSILNQWMSVRCLQLEQLLHVELNSEHSTSAPRTADNEKLGGACK